MRGSHLAVDELDAQLTAHCNQMNKRDLRRIVGSRKHRFPEKYPANIDSI